jgi:hypothetical protein
LHLHGAADGQPGEEVVLVEGGGGGGPDPAA